MAQEPILQTSNQPRFSWLSDVAARILTVLLLVLMFYGYSSYQVRFSDFEDTDNPPTRSGLRVMVDHRTGCQYLASPGGLTVRREADGTPMCTPPAKP